MGIQLPSKLMQMTAACRRVMTKPPGPTTLTSFDVGTICTQPQAGMQPPRKPIQRFISPRHSRAAE